MKRIAIITALFAAGVAFGGEAKAADAVTLANDGKIFTLANGLITVDIDKNTAALRAIKYRGRSLLGGMGIDGYWTLPAMNLVMKAGQNVLKLTAPSGGVMNGVEYHYLRLELDQNAK